MRYAIYGFLYLTLCSLSLHVGTAKAQGTAIPGCSGNLDPTTQENCTFAQELLNAYNGVVSNDPSIIKTPAGSPKACFDRVAESRKELAMKVKADADALNSKGDKHSWYDASVKNKQGWLALASAMRWCTSHPYPQPVQEH